MASKTTKQTKSEQTFTVSRIIGASNALISCDRKVAVGALYGIKPTKQLTLNEAKELVNEWLSKEVK